MYFEVREAQSGLGTSRTGYPVTQSGTGTGGSLVTRNAVGVRGMCVDVGEILRLWVRLVLVVGALLSVLLRRG